MNDVYGRAGMAIFQKKVKENRANSFYMDAVRSGISAFDLKGMKDFYHQKNVDKISESQKKYQKGLQLRNEALGNPVALKANKARTVSADLETGPVDTSNIRNGVPIPPPSNTQGDAKPLFDPAFEKKATFLAGSQDQADAVGY